MSIYLNDSFFVDIFRLQLESRHVKQMDELKNFHKKEKEQLDINFQKVNI